MNKCDLPSWLIWMAVELQLRSLLDCMLSQLLCESPNTGGTSLGCVGLSRAIRFDTQIQLFDA